MGREQFQLFVCSSTMDAWIEHVAAVEMQKQIEAEVQLDRDIDLALSPYQEEEDIDYVPVELIEAVQRV